jgi:hypothetical protein
MKERARGETCSTQNTARGEDVVVEENEIIEGRELWLRSAGRTD